MKQLRSLIRNVPDFPTPGVQFKDVTTLFKSRWGFQKCLDMLTEEYKYQLVDKVAGIEARGFILGANLADRLQCGFVPIRKKGKLPYETIFQSYDLEYGTDELHMHVDSVKEGERILIADDLIATGGTLEASIKLIRRLKGEVVGISCIIELLGLKGRKRDVVKEVPLHTLITYDEI